MIQGTPLSIINKLGQFEDESNIKVQRRVYRAAFIGLYV